MCFSASASFTTAVVLTPVGIYTVKTALQNDRRFLGFALFPLLFGVEETHQVEPLLHPLSAAHPPTSVSVLLTCVPLMLLY